MSEAIWGEWLIAFVGSEGLYKDQKLVGLATFNMAPTVLVLPLKLSLSSGLFCNLKEWIVG